MNIFLLQSKPDSIVYGVEIEAREDIENMCKKKVTERMILGSKMTRGVITDIPVDEDLEKHKQCIYGDKNSRIKRFLKQLKVKRLTAYLFF